MPYRSRSGVKHIVIDPVMQQYRVRFYRGAQYIFGGQYPLTPEGFERAKSALAALLKQHPPPKRDRSRDGTGRKPKRAKPRKPPRLPSTGVRNVYENANRYYVRIHRGGRLYYGGSFPRTPEGLLEAERAALNLAARYIFDPLSLIESPTLRGILEDTQKGSHDADT